MNELAECAAWNKYFDYKESPKAIKNINQRLCFSQLGYPTLLQMAIYCNHERFVDWLISNRADVNITTEVWGTALHVAVKHRRSNFIESLLEAGAMFNKLSSTDNCTPIYHLMKEETDDQESQWTEIFKQFLKKGLDINEICVKPDLTPLEVATTNNNLRAINFLLNFGADINKVNDSNETLLEVAGSQEARELIIKHVIKLKAACLSVSDKTWKIVVENLSYVLNVLKWTCNVEFDIMRKLRDSSTGLFYDQVLQGSEEELGLLKKLSNSEMDKFCERIRKKFKIYSEMLISRAWKARLVVCPVFEWKMIKKYHTLKMNPENIEDINNRLRCEPYGNPTILQLAVFYGDERFVSKLLMIKADVNIVTDVWGTALHVAVMRKEQKIAQKLIKAGATIDKFSSVHSCTPIYHLLKNKKSFSSSICRMLVKKNLDLNEVCVKTSLKTGLTPLEVAIVSESKYLLQSLLDFDVDVNHINANNMTPLEFAESLKTLEKSWPFKNIIKRHIVKLIAAKRKVSVKNRIAVDKFFDGFLCAYENEIEIMKTVMVPGTNTINYFEVLNKSNDQLKRAYKISSKDRVDCKMIEIKFPNYAGLLINRLMTINFKKFGKKSI